MDDKKQQTAVQSVVEETTPTDSPPVEEETTSPQTPQVEPEAQEKTEEVSDSVDVDVESKMTPEQRKAFQDMRLENKKLKEEKQTRTQTESVFNMFRPTAPTGPVDPNTYVDPNTGDFNWNAYNSALISQAGTAATQTLREERDEETAREKYPDVFNNPALEQAVAGRWLAAKIEGKPVSITSLAEETAKIFNKEVTLAEKKAEKRGAEQALTELTEKEQASLGTQGQTSSGSRQAASVEDEQALRERARNGDEIALAKLMSGVSWKK